MHRVVAERLLKDCFGYRDRETFLVVAEPDGAALAEQLAAGARERGFPASLIVMPRRKSAQEEPPDTVAEALSAANIALLVTEKSLRGSRALTTVLKRGLRAGEVTEMSAETLWRLMQAPVAEMGLRAAALSGALEPGSKVRVRSASGTDLEFRIATEREVRDGVIREKGEFGYLPAGLLGLELEPGSLRGTLRVDGWAPAVDASGKHAAIEFEKGAVTSVSEPALRRLLFGASGPLKRPVESFGFGLNAAARVGRSGEESRLTAGTGFLRLGGVPGSAKADDQHALEFVFLRPSVEVGGVPIPETILEAPEIPNVVPPAAVAAEPQNSIELGSDVFRVLFENSNDAQYILDLDTQRFELVNDAFLRMTGYARSDVAGKLRAPDLVAEESKDRVEEKRLARRQVPSERYDVRVRCADGTKKLVEVSVQRLRLAGRDAILGSLRDLTTQERMRRDLTERATDAMRKTLQIYALTEKIKNVPKLTPALLSSTDEEDVLARAARILTQKPGLSYASATIYLIEEDHLVQHFPAPTPRSGPSRFDLSRNHRLARIARGEEKDIDFTASEIALPLQGREGALGVLEVTVDPKEAEVMAGDATGNIKTEYQNLLVSLGQILALAIENLRLFRAVKQQSEIDQLTGVFNRRVFDRRLADEVKRAHRYSRDLALLMIDVDHFKHVNDGFGHQKGDEALKQIARFLKIQSREVDILSRYGGDEFCLLLPECSLDHALQKAELLRKRFVTRKFSTVGRGGKAVRLTLSIGVGSLSDVTTNEMDLLRIADTALYRAKTTRNRVCKWEPETQGASENLA